MISASSWIKKGALLTQFYGLGADGLPVHAQGTIGPFDIERSALQDSRLKAKGIEHECFMQ